jgi:hypothetical protein
MIGAQRKYQRIGSHLRQGAQHLELMGELYFPAKDQHWTNPVGTTSVEYLSMQESTSTRATHHLLAWLCGSIHLTKVDPHSLSSCLPLSTLFTSAGKY